MLLRVDEFCQRVRMELRPLVDDLQEATGRSGQAERDAWSASLPQVEKVLRRTKLGETHIRLANRAGLSLEYRLPASSSWADAVLLGRGPKGPKALFFELKDWATSGDRPGPRAGLIQHQGLLTLHPSEQVKGYVEYCQRFHSAVHQHQASVEGLVFMTRADRRDPYDQPPHDQLTREHPVFCASFEDTCEELPAYLDAQLLGADETFATDFEVGTYRQDRSFVRQMAELVQDPTKSSFVLLDHQRLGLERCLEAVERVLLEDAERAVIVVEGPPGSGKSVLAAQLWARLAADPRMKRNAVLVTTSACQRVNWEEFFEKTGKRKAARGLVIPANQFNPGLTPKWIKQQRDAGQQATVRGWRSNLELYNASGGRTRMPDLSMGVCIVDEAHGLIDPTAPGKEGVAPSGWTMHAGPQAWHILRSSRVSVFLMDSQQSYRDNETTTVDNVVAWAKEFGVDHVEKVNLDEAQFRCAGSKEYLDWLDGLLKLPNARLSSRAWRKTNGSGAFEFELAKDPQDLEDQLRSRMQPGRTVRIVSSYNRPWKTKKAAQPHSLAPQDKDFHLQYERGGMVREWSRIWNYAPGQDYTLFIQASEGSAMAGDPLCEVGCPYVVRGFDYDYLGVIWGADLVWRDGWKADLSRVHESAWKKTRAAARRGEQKAVDDIVLHLCRAYRILLSRAIRGVVVWFEDKQTREHVEAVLGKVS